MRSAVLSSVLNLPSRPRHILSYVLIVIFRYAFLVINKKLFNEEIEITLNRRTYLTATVAAFNSALDVTTTDSMDREPEHFVFAHHPGPQMHRQRGTQLDSQNTGPHLQSFLQWTWRFKSQDLRLQPAIGLMIHQVPGTCDENLFKLPDQVLYPYYSCFH